MQELIDATIAAITAPDAAAGDAARARQAELTKPAGSLGVLEDVSVRLAAIAGVCPPPIPARPVVAVFAGDHGVVETGVTPWPQEVTRAMVENFRSGRAAINVLSNQINGRVVVVDVGVAGEVAADETVWVRKVRPGTTNLAAGVAMTRADAVAAIAVGIEVAEALSEHDLVATGDMGIGNTTPSACLISRFTGQSADAVTGRGTGIDDEGWRLKASIVAEAVARIPVGADPIDVLAAVGGLEHAAIAGFILGSAARGVPIVLDGVISGSAALVAQALAPGAVGYCLAGHRSVEPGHSVALDHLGLRPLLDLNLRLGEGSGAVLAIPSVRAAAAILAQMATFTEAGIG